MLNIDFFRNELDSEASLGEFIGKLESLSAEAKVLSGMAEYRVYALEVSPALSLREEDIAYAMYYALSSNLGKYEDYLLAAADKSAKFWLFGCWSPTFTSQTESLYKLSQWFSDRAFELSQFLASDGFHYPSIDDTDYEVEEEV